MRSYFSSAAVALACVAAQTVGYAQENPLPPVLQPPATSQEQVKAQAPLSPPLFAPENFAPAPSLPPNPVAQHNPDAQHDTVALHDTVAQSRIPANGFDQYRQQPDLGAPSSPGFGFLHFPSSMAMFTQWHRPKAATLTKAQRCAPDQFRPRGFGHLFARPCDSFRMDYNPHVLSNSTSNYGPAYLLRAPDQRCEKCDHEHAGRR